MFDWRQAGLVETQETPEAIQIATPGAGRDAAEAARPATLDVAGTRRVLVHAFAYVPGDYAGFASGAKLETRNPDMERLKARTDEVTQLLSGQAVSADVISEFQEAALVDQAVGRRARYGDLTIIGPRLLGSDVFKLRVLEVLCLLLPDPSFLFPGTRGQH